MMIDRLANLDLYRGLNPLWMRALEFLRDTDLDALAVGRHDLDGDRLFALVQEYQTKPEGECRWEAHRKYCDIQFVARGVERMGVANITRMKEVDPYDADRDVGFFSGSGDFVTVPAGTFVILAPEDVHMPCISAGESSAVKKIVFKAEVR